MCKNQQRKTIREIKKNFSETELRELSIKILKHLEDNIFFQFSKTVILYYSLPDEVYTHHLFWGAE